MSSGIPSGISYQIPLKSSPRTLSKISAGAHLGTFGILPRISWGIIHKNAWEISSRDLWEI